MDPDLFEAVYHAVETASVGVTAALVIVNVFIVKAVVTLNERIHALDMHWARSEGRNEGSHS